MQKIFSKKSFLTTYLVFGLLSFMCVYSFAEQLESNNFMIDGFSVSSGSDPLESTSYTVFSAVGQPANDDRLSSTSYKLGTGVANAWMANVPKISCAGAQDTDPNECVSMASICGESGCYDKASFEIDVQDNPTDALFGIQIKKSSDSAWGYVDGNTNLIETASTRTIADYKTKTDWETLTFNILGLENGITYNLRATAFNGDFTESGPGPVVNFTTSYPTILFDIDIAGTGGSGSETSSPYTVNIGEMTSLTVNTATDLIWFDISTNANNGAIIDTKSLNAGLLNSPASYTIASANADLSAVSEGYGIIEYNSSQTSLGPLNAVGSFDNGGNPSTTLVGGISTTFLNTYSTSTEPINLGRGSFSIKSRPSAIAPAGTYNDSLTFVSTGIY